MKLYTSYYGNLRNIPENCFIVSVSGGLTEELKVAVDSWDDDLSPGKSIFYEHKQKGDWDTFVSRFKAEIIPTIDWLEKLETWEEKANKIKKNLEEIVILCYEAPFDNTGKGQYCHRFILAEQFEKEFKTTVEEYGFGDCIRDGYKLTKPYSTNFLF